MREREGESKHLPVEKRDVFPRFPVAHHGAGRANGLTELEAQQRRRFQATEVLNEKCAFKLMLLSKCSMFTSSLLLFVMTSDAARQMG